jgi:hypothetical protein
MWINNSVSRPLKEGLYRTLVEEDGLGNLREEVDEWFNGDDWCVYNSFAQFTRYWWASQEDYELIANKLENEMYGE